MNGLPLVDLSHVRPTGDTILPYSKDRVCYSGEAPRRVFWREDALGNAFGAVAEVDLLVAREFGLSRALMVSFPRLVARTYQCGVATWDLRNLP